MEKKEAHFLGKINIIAKKVDAITFDFLWDGKPHKIKKLTIIGEKEKRRAIDDTISLHEQSTQIDLSSKIPRRKENTVEN